MTVRVDTKKPFEGIVHGPNRYFRQIKTPSDIKTLVIYTTTLYTNFYSLCKVTFLDISTFPFAVNHFLKCAKMQKNAFINLPF